MSSSGPNSIVGGFVGANGALQFPDGTQLVGTYLARRERHRDGQRRPGSTVGAAGRPELSDLRTAAPPERTCDNGGAFCGGTLFNPDGSPPQPPPQPQPPQPPQPDIPANIPPAIIPLLSPQLNIAAQFTNDAFTEKKQDEVVNINQSSTPARPARPARPVDRRASRAAARTPATPAGHRAMSCRRRASARCRAACRRSTRRASPTTKW